jgi:hypothetical protein
MELDNTNGSTSSRVLSVNKSHLTTTPHSQVDEEVKELDDRFEGIHEDKLVPMYL